MWPNFHREVQPRSQGFFPKKVGRAPFSFLREKALGTRLCEVIVKDVKSSGFLVSGITEVCVDEGFNSYQPSRCITVRHVAFVIVFENY